MKKDYWQDVYDAYEELAERERTKALWRNTAQPIVLAILVPYILCHLLQFFGLI